MCAANNSTATDRQVFTICRRPPNGDNNGTATFRTTEAGVVVTVPRDAPPSLVGAYVNLALALSDPRFYW